MIEMDALDIKLLRDFRRLWSQFLAIALVMAAGVAVLLMSFGMSSALEETRTTYYERNRFADIFVDARSVPMSLLATIRQIEGVASVEARVTTHMTLDIEGKSRATVVYAASLPDSGTSILNEPILRRGRLPDPAATDEIALN